MQKNQDNKESDAKQMPSHNHLSFGSVQVSNPGKKRRRAEEEEKELKNEGEDASSKLSSGKHSFINRYAAYEKEAAKNQIDAAMGYRGKNSKLIFQSALESHSILKRIKMPSKVKKHFPIITPKLTPEELTKYLDSLTNEQMQTSFEGWNLGLSLMYKAHSPALISAFLSHPNTPKTVEDLGMVKDCNAFDLMAVNLALNISSFGSSHLSGSIMNQLCPAHDFEKCIAGKNFSSLMKAGFLGQHHIVAAFLDSVSAEKKLEILRTQDKQGYTFIHYITQSPCDTVYLVKDYIQMAHELNQAPLLLNLEVGLRGAPAWISCTPLMLAGDFGKPEFYQLVCHPDVVLEGYTKAGYDIVHAIANPSRELVTPKTCVNNRGDLHPIRQKMLRLLKEQRAKRSDYPIDVELASDQGEPSCSFLSAKYLPSVKSSSGPHGGSPSSEGGGGC